MSGFQKNLFEHIEKKSSIKPDEIFKVADQVKNANLQDEKTVRQLVRQLAQMANKNISKEKEDKIVNMIIQQGSSLDMNTLNKMIKK
ncbi:stage VI sporulation protein F [Bacillaceae bacterium S4-13-58]